LGVSLGHAALAEEAKLEILQQMVEMACCCQQSCENIECLQVCSDNDFAVLSVVPGLLRREKLTVPPVAVNHNLLLKL